MGRTPALPAGGTGRVVLVRGAPTDGAVAAAPVPEAAQVALGGGDLLRELGQAPVRVVELGLSASICRESSSSFTPVSALDFSSWLVCWATLAFNFLDFFPGGGLGLDGLICRSMSFICRCSPSMSSEETQPIETRSGASTASARVRGP